MLPNEGTLSFGQFDVKYVVGATSLADVVDDEAKARLEMAGQTHHQALMESLMAELERAAFERRHAAAMLALYDVEPGEALAKARQTLHKMTEAKRSLELLREMDLLTGVEALEAAARVGQQAPQELAQFKRGHRALVENLETAMAAGTTVLLACISRTGGATMSDEERAQLRDQWDAAVNTAKRQ